MIRIQEIKDARVEMNVEDLRKELSIHFEPSVVEQIVNPIDRFDADNIRAFLNCDIEEDLDGYLKGYDYLKKILIYNGISYYEADKALRDEFGLKK